jgi:hypothetical protein
MLVGAFAWTTPLAAIGLVTVSLMASGFHLRAGEALAAVETALWACIAGSVVVGRSAELSTAPSLPTDLLAPAIAVLIGSTIINLVLLARRPVPPRRREPQQPAT